MSEIKQTVTQRDAEGVDQAGANVQQSTKQVETTTTTSKKVVATNLVWFIFGFIAIVLAARFVLKLTGANSYNSFVSFVYSVSHIFSGPFDTIFGVSSVGSTRAVFQPSILVAIAVYAIIAWGIVKLINISSNDAQTPTV